MSENTLMPVVNPASLIISLKTSTRNVFGDTAFFIFFKEKLHRDDNELKKE